MAIRIREIEEQARALWHQTGLLAAIENKNAKGARFFLLDGPPYANNIPHVGHIRNTVYKDLYLRDAMMRGHRVLFQPGFDTHGLPIENMVEKQLGIASKQDIERMGIREFCAKCRESAALNKDLWLDVYEQLGSWFSWKTPYLTYENSYIESAWWAFGRFWEQGLVYEGKRPVHWCPHCQTSLAGYEVTDSYKIVSDPGVYVKFKVKGEKQLFLLAFTTTPWTLPANVALCVNGKEEYVKADVKGHGTLIIAKALTTLFDRLKLQYTILETIKGADLEGMEYEPLIDCPIQHGLEGDAKALRVYLGIPLLKERVASKTAEKKGLAAKKDLFEEFVTVTDGTGIVHTAPGHGHSDNAVGKHYGLPEVSPVDDAACFTDGAGRYAGQQVREASHVIAEDLHKEGKLLHYERIEHSYPLCWRCKNPLIFRLSDQWFIRIDPVKEALLEANEAVTWQPGFAGDRMEHWISNAGDWNFSRQRYWGIPLPIWTCACGERKTIASLAELQAAATQPVPDDADLHAVGQYTIRCACGEEMRKVNDIFDVWFDSGCAPFASLGYPYRNKELFEQHYPVSRINESQDQIRGWFYHLLFVNRVACGKPPLQAISMPGWVVDEKGEKMSKSQGNFIGAKDALEEFGADPIRFYYCWDIAPYTLQKFSKTTITNDVLRFFNILWNLTTLTESMKGDGDTLDEPPAEDRWLKSRLASTLSTYFTSIESFELHEGCRAMYEFVINDLSRTYVQFIREREDADVGELMRATLIDVLTALAPITPHASEMAYQRLKSEGMPESVHLREYPKAGKPNPALEEDFSLLQEALAGALAARDKAQIGVRWPIAEARVFGRDGLEPVLENYQDLLTAKLNTKRVSAEPLDLAIEIAPDYAALGKMLGAETADFLEEFPKLQGAIVTAFEAGEPFAWKEHELDKSSFKITWKSPAGWVCVQSGKLMAAIPTERTPELDREGYARELTRRIQNLRKTAGLQKEDRITLIANAPEGILKEALAEHAEMIKDRTGATTLSDEGLDACEHKEEGMIKGAAYAIGIGK